MSAILLLGAKIAILVAGAIIIATNVTSVSWGSVKLLVLLTTFVIIDRLASGQIKKDTITTRADKTANAIFLILAIAYFLQIFMYFYQFVPKQIGIL